MEGELLASLQAVTAAAFAIDGLYGAVCYLIDEQKSANRWAAILATLHELFDLRVPKLQQRVESLFDARDLAVHPWESLEVPVPLADGDRRGSSAMARFSSAQVSAHVDLVLELLGSATQHATTRASKRWAVANRSTVTQLMQERAAAQSASGRAAP